MIDKQEFYRGAAILRIVHDERTESVLPMSGGFLINNRVFVLVKFSTKTAPPWRFTFTTSELEALKKNRDSFRLVVALVCGGDGICAVPWKRAEKILDNPPTWISAQRKFNKRYIVSGSLGELSRRVPHNHWPSILFKEGSQIDE